MFVQIHMLQSMPPGNLNRDETGQPKKCVFGGVTRARISSQCLKRNIRHSQQFKEAFGDALADRTISLPWLVAESVKEQKLKIPDDELNDLMAAIASKFSKEKKQEGQEEGEGEEAKATVTGEATLRTPQLVFFPKPYAKELASLVARFREVNPKGYQFLIRPRNVKLSKDEQKVAKAQTAKLLEDMAKASQRLTVDIGLFGRMTTSDIVVDVDACCQVAHAISTHEMMVESDYFTAMDDRNPEAAAAFLGRGDTETFFNSAVYYKYLNVDTDSLRDKKHLPELSPQDAAKIVGVLLEAAALSTPTGKQNAFASHSAPEFILIEVSRRKQPIAYANAFLQPVNGGNAGNMMKASVASMDGYMSSVAKAFAPADTQRFVLKCGHADIEVKTPSKRAETLAELAKLLADAVAKGDSGAKA